jgi:hypothetical protein
VRASYILMRVVCAHISAIKRVGISPVMYIRRVSVILLGVRARGIFHMLNWIDAALRSVHRLPALGVTDHVAATTAFAC